MSKVYKYKIQDGEHEYEMFSLSAIEKLYIDDFEREAKIVNTFDATDEEIETLKKFGVI